MLIDRLKEKQRAEKLTDTEFGARLGVTREYWNSLKNNKVDINDKFIMKAYRAYPDIFLPNDITKVKDSVTGDNPSSPDKPPSQNLGALWGWVISFFKRS